MRGGERWILIGREKYIGQGGRTMQGREGDKEGEEGRVDRNEIYETFPLLLAGGTM